MIKKVYIHGEKKVRSEAGKGDKNRLRGGSLKSYGESNLWANIDAKKAKPRFKVEFDKVNGCWIIYKYKKDGIWTICGSASTEDQANEYIKGNENECI